jgi:Domain of unknown function (DUF4157)/Lysine-specific metallo-endopeptidase
MRMESRFGHDFGRVRVHDDPLAHESARTVHAQAYTFGHHVVLGAGGRPDTHRGRQLLAHELAHVLQQRDQPSGVPGTLRVSQPAEAAEREAERVAGATEPSDPGRVGTADGGVTLQRACLAALGPPSPACTPAAGEPTGEIFTFLPDCDDPEPGEVGHVNSFVAGLAPGTTLKAHGFASMAGPAAFNDLLSCHRANKLADLLRAAPGAVPVTDVFQHGPVPGPARYRRSAVAEQVLPATPPPVAAPGPAGPAPTTQDCAAWQTTMLTGHLTNARTWVDDAEAKISAFAGGTASPGVTAVVSTALTDNFHTTSPADVATIAANFRALKTALAGSFTYECASTRWCDPNELAYVRGGAAFVSRLFDINACPLWFSCGNYFKRVSTLIHERAHQFPGATDNAYEWAAAYATLSPSDAIDNAESYAVAARQIFHGGAHGPGETC